MTASNVVTLYTKFGQLILRKIIKIDATRCQILRLKCTKFDFGWGSAPDSAGGAYSAPPDPLAGFKGPTSKERGGRGAGEGRDRGEGDGSPGLSRERVGNPTWWCTVGGLLGIADLCNAMFRLSSRILGFFYEYSRTVLCMCISDTLIAFAMPRPL